MATEAQCDSCGETNAPGSSFCLFCGGYLGWDQPGAGPTAGPTGGPPAGPPATSGAAPAPPSGPAAPAPAPRPAPAPAPQPPPPSAGPPPPPGPATTAELPATGSAPAARPGTGAGACPSCGHPNDPGRRFCARCGFALVAAARPPTSQPRAVQPSRGRWGWGNAEEREARRAYRRSLPPLYRWRRVLVALLVVALGVGVVAVVQGNPVTWAQQRYYDIIDKKVQLDDVAAFVEPGDQQTDDVSDSDPSTYWGTPWPAGSAEVESCAEAAHRLRLELGDPVRVRGLRVSPGLREKAQNRLLSPRPRTLLVSWRGEGGTLVCEPFTLPDSAASRPLDLDTEVEVDSVWLSIGSVHPARNATRERPVAVREVRVLTRP